MKFDDLRCHLRSITGVFSLGLAVSSALPCLAIAGEDGEDGSVSILLKLAPSIPDETDDVVADKPAAVQLAPPSLTAKAVETARQNLLVSKPLAVEPPQPAAVLDLDAVNDNAADSSSTASDDQRGIVALPIAGPGRRIFGGRRSSGNSTARKTASNAAPKHTRRPSHADAEPAPMPPGHDVLSIETQPPAAKSLIARKQVPVAANVIDLDALDEARPKKLTLDASAGDDEEAKSGAECPGSPDGIVLHLDSREDDVELEQDDHPYDAPKALSTDKLTKILRPRAESTPQFTAREQAIHRGINDCLHYFIANPENVVRRGPWALMHATLPFGVEAEVVAGGRKVNAIGWMCFNGVCAKQRMFQPTKTGFRTNLGPGVQGHEGQFLAILAQSQVSASYPLQIGRKRYTVNDLVRYEMATCRERSELTFKLIGLAHYLPGDATWRDNRRRVWNLEKMVQEELAQPVIGAACGGSHRLMGLTYAVMDRQREGLPITGHWKRAEVFLQDYMSYALSLQNPDGSFSTEWFKGRGMDRDVERGVQTTGHILEWLIYALPDENLRSPQIQSSVEYLIQSVGKKPSHDWPIGPRGHALRALALYNQRVFGAEVGQMEEHIARSRNSASIR